MMNRLLILCILLASVLSSAVAVDTDEQCSADDGTCDDGVDPSIPLDEALSITITNQSPFRIDIYFDDNDYGSFMATLEKHESTGLNSFIGHSFFVTRHGVKEGLFADPGTDHEKRLKFKVGQRDQVFVVPENAAPSTNRCQDRFGICKSQAASGGCERSPGWMSKSSS